jgi:hypothetical protein
LVSKDEAALLIDVGMNLNPRLDDLAERCAQIVCDADDLARSGHDDGGDFALLVEVRELEAIVRMVRVHVSQPQTQRPLMTKIWRALLEARRREHALSMLSSLDLDGLFQSGAA